MTGWQPTGAHRLPLDISLSINGPFREEKSGLSGDSAPPPRAPVALKYPGHAPARTYAERVQYQKCWNLQYPNHNH